MKKNIYLLPVLTMLIMSGCASKTSVDNIEERLAKLETDLNYQVEELGAKKQETERTFREKSAETKVGIDRLQTEIQRITGRLEELEYKLSQFSALAEQNQKLLSGYNQVPGAQAAGSEQAQGDTAQQTDPNSATGLGQPQEQASATDASKPSADSEDQKEDIYDSSKKSFDGGQFKEARTGFEKFLKSNPKSPKAPSAQFWIGECFYREQWFEKAVLEYQKVIEKFPKSNKAPSAYLKQAYAFERLGEKATAKDVLKELVKKYPGTKESEIAAKKIKGMAK